MMDDGTDPVMNAFDALRDDTRRLDAAGPLLALGDRRRPAGRRPLLVGAVAVVASVIAGIFVFGGSNDGDLLVGPSGEPGVDDAQVDLSAADPASLVTSSWTLVSGTGPAGDVPIVDGWPITLTFDTTRLGGAAACNGYSADYSLDGSRLTIDALSTTQTACDGAVTASEAAFLAAITDTDTLVARGDDLILVGPATELLFRPDRPVPTAELVGPRWLLETLVQGDTSSPVRGNPATLLLDPDIVAGSEPIISFQADGAVSGNLSCNSFRADAAFNNNRFAVAALVQTYRSCVEPGVMDAELAFGTALSGVSEFAIESEGHQLVLTGASTELVFDISDTISIADLLDAEFRGSFSTERVTVRGVAIDTGGGWILCGRTDESRLSGCGGRWVTVTNFDPTIDPTGPGSWTGVLTNDGRFALSGRDPQTTPTAAQQAIADAFADISVEGTTVDVGDLRLADRVLIGLGDQLSEERTPTQLTDPAGWVLAPEYFRGYTGPFSALDRLRRSDDVDVLVGPHNHCGSPPRPIPDEIEFATHLSLQPTGIDSCLRWFTVDLFLDATDAVVAVTLDLSEP